MNPLKSALDRFRLFSSTEIAAPGAAAAHTRVATGTVWNGGVGFGGVSNGLENDFFDAAATKNEAFDLLVSEAIDSLHQSISDIILDKENPRSYVYQTISSCKELLEIFKALLTNDSMLDICRRSAIYTKLFNLLTLFGSDSATVTLLTAPLDESLDSDSVKTCASLLDILATQASCFLTLQQNAIKDGDSDRDDGTSIASLIQSTHTGCNIALSSMAQSAAASTSSLLQKVDIDGAVVSPVNWRLAEEARYRRALSGLRSLDCNIVESIISSKEGFSHVFLGRSDGQKCTQADLSLLKQSKEGATAVTPPSRGWVRRIASEISDLRRNLPVEHGSSIFVRYDESRMDILKVLIIGPEGTPYENGAFEFDIMIPADYPSRPPFVHLVTTGNGSVRFNPNLYNCGKVCLSLLGTWSGPGWDPKVSTLLQVLVSLQSLVFVPDPYFNEPGYESSYNSESGKRSSEQYSFTIKNATLRWAILDQMKKQAGPFQDILASHFRLKKMSLLEQVAKWKSESCESSVCDEIAAKLSEFSESPLDISASSVFNCGSPTEV